MSADPRGSAFNPVIMYAANQVLAQDATALLQAADGGGWSGELNLDITHFNLTDAGELRLQLPNGKSGRLVIVDDSVDKASVQIRGFGPRPF